jgi:O-antigen ligase
VSAVALARRSPWPSLGVVGTVLGLAFLAGSAVFVSSAAPLLPFMALALVGAVAFAFAQPVPAVCVAVLAIPLDAMVVQGGTYAGITPGQALLLLTAFAWTLRWVTRRPLVLVRSQVAVGLALLVIATGIGLFLAPEPGNVFKQFVNWGAFLVIFQLIVTEATPRSARTILFAFVLCAGATALLAMAIPGASGIVGDDRLSGSFGTPNGLGIFLALAIPLQLAFALRGPVALRPVALGAFGASAVALSLTQSRGAFLGLAVALLVLALWRPFRRAAGVALLVLVTLALAGSNPLSSVIDSDRVVERVTSTRNAGAVDPRAEVYRITPQMIADHPVFGVGALEFGSFSTRYGLPVAGGVTTHAHSIPLTIAAELGIIGVLGLVWMAVALGAALRRALARTRGIDLALSFGLAASFAALLAEGIVDYPLPNNNITGVIVALAACAVVLSRTEAQA